MDFTVKNRNIIMKREMIYWFAQGLRKVGFSLQEEKNIQVQEMQKAIKKLAAIQFKIEVQKDGSWVAESVNIDGIITGGTNKDRINETLKDAIFTFFEIPPHLCNDALIQSSDEPIKLMQKVYA